VNVRYTVIHEYLETGTTIPYYTGTMKNLSGNLDAVKIVLVEPQVPGNVGAAARAMKNMGLSKLVLVNPWFKDHPQSRYMAHGSENILARAVVCRSLGEAIADSVLVAGTTQRRRHGIPFREPRDAAPDMLAASLDGPVSILFGREDKGLSNAELKFCQLVLTIPASPPQPSLNLSQAVMVIAYELFTAAVPERERKFDPAPSHELETMYGHLERSLTALGLRQWNEGDNYMKSLRRVFSRTKLERRDTATIHKLCGEIDKFVLQAGKKHESGEAS